MEGQRHNNPLNPRCFCLQRPHAIVEAAKALGGSFKLVKLVPKTQGDVSPAQGNIKEWWHTNKSKSTNEHTKHKPRLNYTKTLGPTWTVWTGHGKLPMYSLYARDHFNCSPLLFSWPAPRNRCGQIETGGRCSQLACSHCRRCSRSALTTSAFQKQWSGPVQANTTTHSCSVYVLPSVSINTNTHSPIVLGRVIHSPPSATISKRITSA